METLRCPFCLSSDVQEYIEGKTGMNLLAGPPDGEQINGIVVYEDKIIVATCSGVYELSKIEFIPIKPDL